MNIVYLMMVHNDLDNACQLIDTLLLDKDAKVVLHLDMKFAVDCDEVSEKLNAVNHDRVYYARRTHVEWGEWGMIEASLNCFDVLDAQSLEYDYAILMSGACFPIKPYEALKHFLTEANGKSFIEFVNANEQQWVFDGLQKERWEVYHFLNWRKNPVAFSKVVDLQEKMKVRRQLPDNFVPYMGSQWWALSKDAVDKLARYSASKHVKNFYKRTWIPDELYFQTLAGNLIEHDQLENSNLTYYHFDLRGAPKVLYASHFEELIQTDNKFFARKLSPKASELRHRLTEVYTSSCENFADLKADLSHSSSDAVSRSTPNRLLQPVGNEAQKLETFAPHFFVIIGDVDYQLHQFKNKLNEISPFFCHGLLYKEGKSAYHEDYDGYRKPLVLSDEHFIVDDLLDVLVNTPEHKSGGFLLNYPDPETPKILNHLIEAHNVTIFHVLTSEAGYINRYEYSNEMASIDDIAQSQSVSSNEIESLKQKVFAKHFTYDYGFSQWVGSKPCTYHQIWYNENQLDTIVKFFSLSI